MMLLREECVSGILTRCKSGAVNNPREPAVAINQGVLERRRFLIQTDLVLLHTFAANKTALVRRFFVSAIGAVTHDAAPLNSIPANLRQNDPRAINEYDGFGDLLPSESIGLVGSNSAGASANYCGQERTT